MHYLIRFHFCLIAIICGYAQVIFANIPAAYLACEGAAERAPCALPGPQYGVCITDTLCTDPPETSVNECVICVDECWASQDGLECVRPWTGELGVCESQDRCTDKPETSFEECRRCVDGKAWSESNTENQMNTLENEGCAHQLLSRSRLSISLSWLASLSSLIFVMIFLRIKIKKQNDRNLDE